MSSSSGRAAPPDLGSQRHRQDDLCSASLATGEDEGVSLHPDLKVGYYRQDFSGLDFGATAYAVLESAMEQPSNEELRVVAAKFLITSDVLKQKVATLSEGQKACCCFARFVLQRPGS